MKSEKAVSDKQEFKRRRVKMYFLDAAKEIIINEGVENITVRKVADIAGYSNVMIYHYFTDLNELLWDVKAVMINDLAEYMQEKMHETLYNIDGIKRLFETYIAYYFENPNVFKFFYLHRLSKPANKNEEKETEPDYNQMWKEAFKGFVLEGILDEKDIEVIAQIFIYAIHGLLTLNFSGQEDLTEENVYKVLGRMIDYILRKK